MARRIMYPRGFSLIETTISLAIMLTLGGSAVAFLATPQRAFSDTISRVRRAHAAERAGRIFVRDIRAATRGPDQNAVLRTATPNELILTTDQDGDARAELVRYFIEDSSLKRSRTAATGTPPRYPATPDDTTILIETLTGPDPLFTYYTDAATPPLGDTETVQARLITLMFSLPDVRPISYQSQATIRSRP